MSWDSLFADLEAQARSLEVLDRAAELAERTRLEMAQVSLFDRLGGARGTQISCATSIGVTLHGVLLRRGAGWFLLDEQVDRQALVMTSAVRWYAGMGAPVAPAGEAERRLGPNSALRALATDRSNVAVMLGDGQSIEGTIDRVGADFIDIAAHPGRETRRDRDVRGVFTVATHAIAVVRSQAR